MPAKVTITLDEYIRRLSPQEKLVAETVRASVIEELNERLQDRQEGIQRAIVKTVVMEKPKKERKKSERQKFNDSKLGTFACTIAAGIATPTEAAETEGLDTDRPSVMKYVRLVKPHIPFILELAPGEPRMAYLAEWFGMGMPVNEL